MIGVFAVLVAFVKKVVRLVSRLPRCLQGSPEIVYLGLEDRPSRCRGRTPASERGDAYQEF